ncbi:Pirin domain-containing protein [Methanosarcina sp. 2.H.T.1A.6]|nr:Pirin domain-containing protein [Methanosarcina sp. 2.H.T.1A.3]KKG18823.1 Pirin domain-containing protein [Methanosarcina sp. 2.H.T.1A.15]KKG21069.1 Pirin domain-containing protein [Methanosarcina sp. 2.H.T.1A.6]KKG23815.1 Pirin domain-containing protein [Methanosarcina sp. 2.H.T.1A.8]
MIRIIPAETRHLEDSGWLKSYMLFSFSNYYDPDNVRFGSLCVFNDDTVQQGRGFSTHPHSEMEIISVVLEGEITHEDNMGNKGVLGKGEVQCITAGTGIQHSELNTGKEPLHFYQIWILPSGSRLEPAYSQKKFEESGWKNQLLPLASGQGFEHALKINADATIFRSCLEKGNIIHFNSQEKRCIFIYISAGELSVNGQRIGQGDQARIDLEQAIHMEAVSSGTPAEFFLIDVPRQGSKKQAKR